MGRLVNSVKRRLMPLLPAGHRRRLLRAYWEYRWTRPDQAAPWQDRDVPSEVVEAVDSGWFATGSPAVDLGCGRGDVAAWLAGRGFPSVGVDISASAIALAHETHGGSTGRLEFLAADLSVDPLPDRDFAVLVDRGCFHQLDARDRAGYAGSLMRSAAADARFLLFVKAFRDGGKVGDPEEVERRTDEVERAFGSAFTIDRVTETMLDRHGTLPGLVFWMARRRD